MAMEVGLGPIRLLTRRLHLREVRLLQIQVPQSIPRVRQSRQSRIRLVFPQQSWDWEVRSACGEEFVEPFCPSTSRLEHRKVVYIHFRGALFESRGPPTNRLEP